MTHFYYRFRILRGDTIHYVVPGTFGTAMACVEVVQRNTFNLVQTNDIVQIFRFDSTCKDVRGQDTGAFAFSFKV